MEKWNEPKTPPPKWLDISAEITTDAPKLSRDKFVVTSMDSCVALGCDPEQAAGVVANALNESAWGQSYRAWNLGGWKITHTYAEDYLREAGTPALYWVAPGNKAPFATPTDLKGGDPPWCYYRAFGSLQDYYAAWISHFVPQPSKAPLYPGYARCGSAFWSGGSWFPLLCAAGYKGENTRKHPEGAIAEHGNLCNAAIIRWVQSKLCVVVDGHWGRVSHQACLVWQGAHGLPRTGEPTRGTLRLLSGLATWLR